MIESITPHSTLCQSNTHTHAFAGSPMGHSDTVQIKKETDGYVERKRVSMCVCVSVFVWYIFIFV